MKCSACDCTETREIKVHCNFPSFLADGRTITPPPAIWDLPFCKKHEELIEKGESVDGFLPPIEMPPMLIFDLKMELK